MLRQIACLKESNLFGAMHGSRQPLRGHPGAFAGSKIKFEGMTICIGDVVWRNRCAAKVIACAEEDDDLYVLVQVWAHHEIVTAYSGRWRATAVSEAWPVEEITVAFAWFEEGGNFVVLT